ncbi:hypothetical protein SKAU_G00082580 [Synaphobranchus kaupii]|uniref:Uncharacterized protein n=1 Tax=Synaphobranchus kaupii TaxID=118154 RepID=A0A9Q1FVZ3_SYNKA|nr:hypothetical protein SKAU_G00082580 [Synaphobranchus kaupii]
MFLFRTIPLPVNRVQAVHIPPLPVCMRDARLANRLTHSSTPHLTYIRAKTRRLTNSKHPVPQSPGYPNFRLERVRWPCSLADGDRSRLRHTGKAHPFNNTAIIIRAATVALSSLKTSCTHASVSPALQKQGVQNKVAFEDRPEGGWLRIGAVSALNYTEELGSVSSSVQRWLSEHTGNRLELSEERSRHCGGVQEPPNPNPTPRSPADNVRPLPAKAKGLTPPEPFARSGVAKVTGAAVMYSCVLLGPWDSKPPPTPPLFAGGLIDRLAAGEFRVHSSRRPFEVSVIHACDVEASE